jgi:hypothetical protein
MVAAVGVIVAIVDITGLGGVVGGLQEARGHQCVLSWIRSIDSRSTDLVGVALAVLSVRHGRVRESEREICFVAL